MCGLTEWTNRGKDIPGRVSCSTIHLHVYSEASPCEFKETCSQVNGISDLHSDWAYVELPQVTGVKKGHNHLRCMLFKSTMDLIPVPPRGNELQNAPPGEETNRGSHGNP